MVAAISGTADMQTGFARSERAVEQRIGPDSRAHGERGAPACRSILVWGVFVSASEDETGAQSDTRSLNGR
jgi:hypothetical protein